MPRLFYGALITPDALTTYRALPHALLCVADDGEIAWREDDVPAGALLDVLAKRGLAADDPNVYFVELGMGEFLVPGFVDTHTVSRVGVCRTCAFVLKICAAWSASS